MLKAKSERLSAIEKIDVGSRCRERLENMPLQAHGAYCNQCNKRVWDLTRLTKNEARVLLAVTGGKCCVAITRQTSGPIKFLRSRFLGLLNQSAREELPLFLSCFLGLGCFFSYIWAKTAYADTGTKLLHNSYSTSTSGPLPILDPGPPKNCPENESSKLEVFQQSNQNNSLTGSYDPPGVYGDLKLADSTSIALVYLEGAVGALGTLFAFAGCLILAPIALIKKSRVLKIVALFIMLLATTLIVLRVYVMPLLYSASASFSLL